MGCGESKHAVATADTISQTKRSNSKKTDGSENQTSIEKTTDDVKTSTNTSLEEQEKGGHAIAIPENGNDKEGENVNKVSEDVNAKESENPKAENVKENDHQEHEESAVETAQVNENKEAEVVDDDTKNTSQKEELKEESTEESKKEEGKAGPDSPQGSIEEALNETEGNQNKEGEDPVKTDETEELANTGEEKAPGANEENATESSAQDPKTT